AGSRSAGPFAKHGRQKDQYDYDSQNHQVNQIVHLGDDDATDSYSGDVFGDYFLHGNGDGADGGIADHFTGSFDQDERRPTWHTIETLPQAGEDDLALLLLYDLGDLLQDEFQVFDVFCGVVLTTGVAGQLHELVFVDAVVMKLNGEVL